MNNKKSWLYTNFFLCIIIPLELLEKISVSTTKGANLVIEKGGKAIDDALLIDKIIALLPSKQAIREFLENIWKEEWKTRTMSEIQDYFFPDAKIKSRNKITICDTTEAFQDINIINSSTPEALQPLEEIIIQTYGVGRIPLDLGNMDIYKITQKGIVYIQNNSD